MDHRKSSLQVFENYLRNNSGMGGFVKLVKKETTKKPRSMIRIFIFYFCGYDRIKKHGSQKSLFQIFENYLRNRKGDLKIQ